MEFFQCYKKVRSAGHPLHEVFGSLGLNGFLQGLKLINSLLGVALADLTQGLVLVAACPDVIIMEQVGVGLPVLDSGLFQL